ncbi:MAG: DHA2 family efflux MFS transporter permease subunit [Acetobacteraceae bacterium]
MSATTAEGGIFTISGRQWLILLMVQLSNLLFGMTITIANVVLPQVRGSLSATQDEISWVITLNLVATAVATPMTGWLASRMGWRNLMLLAVGGFTLSSFLCGIANSLETLVIYRIGQGMFGAPIMPMGQAILLASFPRHLQPTALVMWGVGAVFGPVLGPILGSMMAEAYDDWRTAFFMIVPPGIAALTCIWFALSDRNESKPTYFDWTGFIALSVAIISAQLIFDRGQKLDWYESNEIIMWTVLGALAFWIFVIHCLTAQRPFLDPRLLMDRNFSVGIAIAFVMGMLSFTTLTLFPTLLHDLRGYPDSAIGTLLAARGLGNWAAFLVIVKLTRIAPRFAIASGLAMQAFSAYAMAQFDINVRPFDIFWTSMLQGFGQSITFTPMTVMAFATLPKHQITEGSSVFTLMRNFGSSLFISITVVTLIRSTRGSYAALNEYISPYNRLRLMPGWPDAWNTDSLAGLTRLSNEVQRQASMIGYVNSFYLLSCAAAVAIPFACLMRKAAQEQP